MHEMKNALPAGRCRSAALARPKRRQLGAAAAVLSVRLFGFCGSAVGAEDGPPGLIAPTALPAFDRDAPTCTGRPDLEKVLTFAQDNEREFMQGVRRGLAAAAEDRRLAFRAELAGNDATRMNELIDTLRDQKVGAVVASPVDPISLAPHLQKLIWDGAFVGTIVPPPAECAPVFDRQGSRRCRRGLHPHPPRRTG